ncbi:MAG: hypothetical protein M1813_008384 [Trichoglossum hirsutum]|jgi:hypothetical protein|nr:MAG: hypothetical protein M1813_008384 [Trichoglossum hirsutum]
METTDSACCVVESPLVAQEAEPVPQHSDSTIDRKVIDEDGDILVQIGSKEMLVSSKILILASPVFKAMLKSNFLEGNTARSTQHPLKLPLPDDDPDALTVLFQILHFSPKRKRLEPDVDLQLELAQLADKYDCVISIHAESEQWLHALNEVDHESSILWKLSTIAFLMGHTEKFANFTAKLALTLSAAQLDGTTLVPSLPISIKGWSRALTVPEPFLESNLTFEQGALHQLRTRVLCTMMGEVENSIDELRHDEQQFETGSKICTDCGRYKPPPARKCHPCNNEKFRPVNCDARSRVFEFLGALSSANIWPISRKMEGSALDFRSSTKISRSKLHHNCNGRLQCPLVQVAVTLESRVGGVMSRAVGLDLRSFKADGSWSAT